MRPQGWNMKICADFWTRNQVEGNLLKEAAQIRTWPMHPSFLVLDWQYKRIWRAITSNPSVQQRAVLPKCNWEKSHVLPQGAVEACVGVCSSNSKRQQGQQLSSNHLSSNCRKTYQVLALAPQIRHISVHEEQIYVTTQAYLFQLQTFH